MTDNEKILILTLCHILRATKEVPKSRNEHYAKFFDFLTKRVTSTLEKVQCGEVLDTMKQIEALKDKNYKLKLENDELKQVINGLKGRK